MGSIGAKGKDDNLLVKGAKELVVGHANWLPLTQKKEETLGNYLVTTFSVNTGLGDSEFSFLAYLRTIKADPKTHQKQYTKEVGFNVTHDTIDIVFFTVKESIPSNHFEIAIVPHTLSNN